MIAGLNVVPSEFAVRRWVEFRVEAWPIRKRRRSYRVRRVEREEPGCYQVGSTLFMHPAIFRKLEAA